MPGNLYHRVFRTSLTALNGGHDEAKALGRLVYGTDIPLDDHLGKVSFSSVVAECMDSATCFDETTVYGCHDEMNVPMILFDLRT